MGWLKKAWAFIRKLPVAKYIKPLWKSGLAYLVQSEGDRLQGKIGDAIEQKGPEAAGKLIDDWGNAIRKGLMALPLPHGIEVRVLGILYAKQSDLRTAIADAIKNGGRPAADLAFDRVQQGLLEKIAAL